MVQRLQRRTLRLLLVSRRDESQRMWSEYAKHNGVRIRSTIAAIRSELSNPPLLDDETWNTDHDGFTIGQVKYIDFDRPDIYETLCESLSSVVPMFRKRGGVEGFEHEREYRLVLRAGSSSSRAAKTTDDCGVHIPVSLQNLINEVRCDPTADLAFLANIKSLLADYGLSIPVIRSSLSPSVDGV